MAKKITIEFTAEEAKWLYFTACDSFLKDKHHKDWFHPLNLTWKEIFARQKKAQYYLYSCKNIVDAKMLVAAWDLKEYDILIDTLEEDQGELSFVVWCKKSWR